MKLVQVGAGPFTTASFPVSDPGNQWQTHNWHLYTDGVFGAAGSLAVQYSPDDKSVPDASSRWHAPATLTVTTVTDVVFTARFRKLRFVFTGGDGTTNLTAEVV